MAADLLEARMKKRMRRVQWPFKRNTQLRKRSDCAEVMECMELVQEQKQTRSRGKDGAKNGGVPCSGPSKETRNCKVDCKWKS